MLLRAGKLLVIDVREPPEFHVNLGYRQNLPLAGNGPRQMPKENFRGNRGFDFIFDRGR
jgi:hypothetical protein